MAAALNNLQVLMQPFEILDMKDGESVEFTVDKWERGRATIYPKHLPPGTPKEIPVIRVHVDPKWKKIFPFYWDITSLTLQAQLLPYLEAPQYRLQRYVIKKFGVAPRARFTLEVSPYP